MEKSKSVDEVAHLACLKISEDKINLFQKQFDNVLQHFEKIAQLETEGIEPMVTPHLVASLLRADQVQQDLDVHSLLENAPEVKDSLFKVPPVV